MIFIKKKICYIIGASQEGLDEVIVNDSYANFIIAADGGFDALLKSSISPDLLLGDFDSINNLPECDSVLKFPVEKDYTDTFLAYEEGAKKGYCNFVIYGGTGGRLDHTIANIQTLANISKNGGRGFLIGNGTVITAVTNSVIEFPAETAGKAGVFAFGGDAIGVDISGMKYTAQKINISPYFPLGVSNEFINKSAKISVGNGTLIIVWYETSKQFSRNIDKYLI
ncbi:MAG: thiamine diphosphokinase [Clostridia bacterium]|nr:thiamine diphosphokinase [Clostridia bacterium]